MDYNEHETLRDYQSQREQMKRASNMRRYRHQSHYQITLSQLVSSAESLCKQFGTFVGPDLDPNCLTL